MIENLLSNESIKYQIVVIIGSEKNSFNVLLDTARLKIVNLIEDIYVICSDVFDCLCIQFR